jgi:hypothetical protein
MSNYFAQTEALMHGNSRRSAGWIWWTRTW